jgi:hypothetical protein
MTLRQIIKNQILDYTHEHNIELTQEELRIATNGVEYYISEVMADSVKDSVNDTLYSRKLDAEKI